MLLEVALGVVDAVRGLLLEVGAGGEGAARAGEHDAATSGLASAATSSSTVCALTSLPQALSRSGRSMVTTATPSRTSVRAYEG